MNLLTITTGVYPKIVILSSFELFRLGQVLLGVQSNPKMIINVVNLKPLKTFYLILVVLFCPCLVTVLDI